MSKIRELNVDEMALVSGGNANSNFEGDHSRHRGASTHYGGQANGFQSNYAAANGTGSCGPGTVAGLISGIAAATVATGGLTAAVGFLGGMASGMIGGQCFSSGASSSGSKSGPPFH